MSQRVKLCPPMSLEHVSSWHVHLLLSSYCHWYFSHFTHMSRRFIIFILCIFYWGHMVPLYIKALVSRTYPPAFKYTCMYTMHTIHGTYKNYIKQNITGMLQNILFDMSWMFIYMDCCVKLWPPIILRWGPSDV